MRIRNLHPMAVAAATLTSDGRAAFAIAGPRTVMTQTAEALAAATSRPLQHRAAIITGPTSGIGRA